MLRSPGKQRKQTKRKIFSDFFVCRPSIPFLQYPSTYYQEVNSASYNWIPVTFGQNNILQIKLAKYSPTGQYLGLFDAYDAYLLLCGGSYTDGKPSFTFGTHYKKTVSEKTINILQIVS